MNFQTLVLAFVAVLVAFNIKFYIDHHQSPTMTSLYPGVSINDPNSFANNHQLKVEHYEIHWQASFTSKKLIGHVILHTRLLIDNPLSFVLDARSIAINSVSSNDNVLKYYIPSESDRELEGYPQAYGQPVVIHLEDIHPLKQNDLIQIRIDYTTTEQSEAIQWLSAEQTAGKKHPFLFTQAQAIHARSMLPCQDSPSSKATYTTFVNVEKPLVAVMSAAPIGQEDQGNTIVYKFEQKIPIPTYLIALGIGALKSVEIGPRSVLWSEEELLSEGAYEFANTEKFIKAAEEFLPEYQWGRYDILLLPPAFPYGGMENPMLTFVTPTLLAGDRSLENVVAHEIAHSWSGNLVTNKNWASFWLNEGFTVYIERRIIARLYGEAEAELHAMLGWSQLVESLEMYEEMKAPQLTKMIPELTKVDPDDAFSSLPYEKGFNFLYYLSKQIVESTENFEKFLFSYFTKFAKQSISAEDMKSYFLEYFSTTVSSEKLASIEWDKWFYSEGYPVVRNSFDTSRFDVALKLAEKWVNDEADKTQISIDEWSSNQICLFLDTLLGKDSLPHATINELESTYKFTGRKNTEIRFTFLMIALKANHEEFYPHAIKLATEQGRMKFTRPLFRSLSKAKNGRQLAVDAFTQHSSQYHLICSRMVAKDLGLSQ